MNRRLSDSVVVFNLETHEFKECAKLNEARMNSSSTIAGEIIYVFAGYNAGYLDTIEALDVSSASSKWDKFRSHNFTPRREALVCSLTAHRILICGGDYSDPLNDVLVFDTKTKKTRKVADSPMPFDNYGNNQAYIERDGVVLALAGSQNKG